MMKPLIAYYNALFNSSSPKICFIENKSCGKVIRAHSISKSRILDEIAEEGYILSIVPGDPQNGFIDIGPVGKGQLSTFAGFCSKHDQAVFNAVDINPYTPQNTQQEFLLMYRAMARNYWYELTNLRMHRKQLDLFSQGKLNELRTFIPFDITSRMINGWQVAYNDAVETVDAWEKIRTKLNKDLASAKYNNTVVTIAIVMPNEHPIAASGIGLLTHGRDARTSRLEPHPFSITLFPQQGRTYALLSCLNLPYKKYMLKSLQAHEELMEKDYRVILTNMLANIPIESLAIQPSYWTALPAEQRTRFMQRWRDKNLNNTPRDLYDPTLNIFSC